MSSNATSIPEPAVAALRQGKKVEAIKLTREATAMGLKDSKEAVEAFLRDHHDVRKDYDSSRPAYAYDLAGGRGSNLSLLAFVIIVTWLMYWFVFRQ